VILPRFLLDENLSPKVGVTLQSEGLDVVHVRDRGLLGATDAVVLERAFQEDRIVVTSNVDDFVRLARTREIHSGIILVEESGLTRDEQLTLVRRALNILQEDSHTGRGLINRVLRIWVDRNMFEDLPSD
jgi:predicted nuclease of predicted toxin-antitoxin system